VKQCLILSFSDQTFECIFHFPISFYPYYFGHPNDVNEGHKILSFSFCYFLRSALASFSNPSILLTISFLTTHKLSSFHWVEYPISHQHNATDKTEITQSYQRKNKTGMKFVRKKLHIWNLVICGMWNTRKLRGRKWIRILNNMALFSLVTSGSGKRSKQLSPRTWSWHSRVSLETVRHEYKQLL
jgi:hypothetical protein